MKKAVKTQMKVHPDDAFGMLGELDEIRQLIKHHIGELDKMGDRLFDSINVDGPAGAVRDEIISACCDLYDPLQRISHARKVLLRMSKRKAT